MNKKELGAFGEIKANNYLQQIGHEVLHQNWRFLKLEIDLISKFENKIHFTEVKTRNTAEIGEPWKAVTKGKQKFIIKAADHYLKSTNTELESQFNIVSIVHNQYRSDLEFIPDAFTP